MRRLKKCTSVFCIKQLEHKNSPAVEVELKRKIRYKHEQFVNKNRFKLTINENGKRGERREREREREESKCVVPDIAQPYCSQHYLNIQMYKYKAMSCKI